MSNVSIGVGQAPGQLDDLLPEGGAGDTQLAALPPVLLLQLLLATVTVHRVKFKSLKQCCGAGAGAGVGGAEIILRSWSRNRSRN